MLIWLLVNISLCVLALGFIMLNDSAPHRLRFQAAFIALAVWLIPWPLVADVLPTLIDVSRELARLERAMDAGSARLTGVYSIIVQTGSLPVPLVREVLVFTVPELVLLVLTLCGVLLFAWQLSTHHSRLSRLAHQSDNGSWLWQRAGLQLQYPVLVQAEIPGAFSSGLLHPLIWVHKDLVASSMVGTVLQHEATHIHQHDNWYLLLITLVEKVFWWNPLVWLLGRKARTLQELSCDELCQRHSNDYSVSLAQLMLDSAKLGNTPQHMALGANILNNPNPNIERIKLLQRSYAMKPRHLFSAVFTAVSAVLGIGLVAAQPETVEPVAGERMLVINRAVVEGESEMPTILFRDGNGADVTKDVLMMAPQGAVRMISSRATAEAGDQFMAAAGQDDEMKLSFSFVDVPLPMVLSQMATILNGAHKTPSPEALEILHTAMLEDEAVVFELEPGEIAEQRIKWVEALPAREAGSVVGVASGVVVATAGRAVPAMMLSDNVVLEYPEAAERMLSISVMNVSLDEALDQIAEASGCNIFRDGDNIVVDYCD